MIINTAQLFQNTKNIENNRLIAVIGINTNNLDRFIGQLISKYGIQIRIERDTRFSRDDRDRQRENYPQAEIKLKFQNFEEKIFYLSMGTFQINDTNDLIQYKPQLRIYDGIIFHLNLDENINFMLENLIYFICENKIKPIICVDNLFECILRGDDSSLIFSKINDLIEFFNTIISQFIIQGDTWIRLIDFYSDDVLFGSSKFNWFFQFSNIVKILQMNKLQFEIKNDKTTFIEFIQFIYEPTTQMTSSQEKNQNDFEKLKEILIMPDNKIVKEDDNKNIKNYVIFNQYIDNYENIIDEIIRKFPNPKQAQQKQIDLIYNSSSLSDQGQQAIYNCDPNGPILVEIFKREDNENKNYYVYGRIYSGTLFRGSQVNIKILQNGIVINKSINVFITNLAYLTQYDSQSLDYMSCGNTISLINLFGQNQSESICTISDLDIDKFTPFQNNNEINTNFCFAIQLKPQMINYNSQLIQNLQKNSQILFEISEITGNYIIKFSKLSNLNQFKKNLIQQGYKDHKIENQLYLLNCQTICIANDKIMMKKSPNKHNRIYGYCQPLNQELIQEFDKKQSMLLDPLNIQNKNTWFNQKLLLKQDEKCSKLWSLGHNPSQHLNCLIEKTTDLNFFSQIKENVVQAFEWVTNEGILTNSPLVGVKFYLTDCILHQDSIHRGAGQIIPTTRNFMYACIAQAYPQLLLPTIVMILQISFKLVQIIETSLQDLKSKYLVQIEKIQNNQYIFTIKGDIFMEFKLAVESLLGDKNFYMIQAYFLKWDFCREQLEQGHIQKIRQIMSLQENLQIEYFPDQL